jgi:hypothetical protein
VGLGALFVALPRTLEPLEEDQYALPGVRASLGELVAVGVKESVRRSGVDNNLVRNIGGYQRFLEGSYLDRRYAFVCTPENGQNRRSEFMCMLGGARTVWTGDAGYPIEPDDTDGNGLCGMLFYASYLANHGIRSVAIDLCGYSQSYCQLVVLTKATASSFFERRIAPNCLRWPGRCSLGCVAAESPTG